MLPTTSNWKTCTSSCSRRSTCSLEWLPELGRLTVWKVVMALRPLNLNMSLSNRPSATRTEEYPIADEPSTVEAASISDSLSGVTRVSRCQKNSKIAGPRARSNNRKTQRTIMLASDVVPVENLDTPLRRFLIRLGWFEPRSYWLRIARATGTFVWFLPRLNLWTRIVGRPWRPPIPSSQRVG